MSKRNSLAAKKERRIRNFLRKITIDYNRVQYREIDGQQFPYQNPYKNFLQSYLDGNLEVIENKDGGYSLKDVKKPN